MKRGRLAVDGASRGNPGPSGIGVVIYNARGRVVREISEYIGEGTNNVAEYTALLRGLREALSMGFTHVAVQTDSELVARQISGEYRVKNAGISPLHASTLDLLSEFAEASVNHVAREANAQADALASKGAAASNGEPVQMSLFEIAPEGSSASRQTDGQEED